MVSPRLVALAAVIAGAVRCLAAPRPEDYIDLVSEFKEKPEVIHQLKRVVRRMGEGKIPFVEKRLGSYFDVDIPGLGLQIQPVYPAFRTFENGSWGFNRRPQSIKSHDRICSPDDWYYRQGISPNKTEVNTAAKPLANQDYEVINANYNDALTLTVSQSKAKLLSSAAHWNFEKSDTKASEDGTTSTEEDSHTRSDESSTTIGGSATGGANGVFFSGSVEGHADHTWSGSQDSASSQSQSTTSTTSNSDTVTKGQGKDATRSNEFTDDVSLQAECPPRSICTVQTWTFSIQISGRCPKILFYDFEPCLRGIESAKIYMGYQNRGDRSLELSEPWFKYPAKVSMSSINFAANENMNFTMAASLSEHFFAYREYPKTTHYEWDGLIMPRNDTGITYKQNPPCDVTYPALQPDGTPHRVQFLFVQPLDGNNATDANEKRNSKRADVQDQSQVQVLRSTLD